MGSVAFRISISVNLRVNTEHTLQQRLPVIAECKRK